MKTYQDNKHKIKFPVEASYKLDGVFAYADFIKREFRSKNDKLFVMPTKWFDHITLPLFNPKGIMVGELYRHNMGFEKIISAVKDTKDTNTLVCDLNFTPHSEIKRHLCESEEALDKLLDIAIADGYEGLVIHTLTEDYKYKPVNDKEYKILDVIEGTGKLEGKVGKLVFDGFSALPKGSHEGLAKLWIDRDKLIGKFATVEYQNLTKNGIPRFPKVKSIRDYE